MKRRACRIITRAIVFIIAGAIVNVAVAWGCTLRWRSLDREYGGNIEPDSIHARWLQRFNWPSPDSRTFISHKRASTFGWIDDHYTISFKPYDAATTAGLWRTRCGWPCLGLQGISQSGNNSQLGGGEFQVGLFYFDGELIGRPQEGWHSPISPLGLGFAINTIFYAAILWLVFAAPGKIRRWRRIMRGLCPACAYPIGTSDICTECGERVKG